MDIFTLVVGPSSLWLIRSTGCLLAGAGTADFKADMREAIPFLFASGIRYMSVIALVLALPVACDHCMPIMPI